MAPECDVISLYLQREPATERGSASETRHRQAEAVHLCSSGQQWQQAMRHQSSVRLCARCLSRSVSLSILSELYM